MSEWVVDRRPTAEDGLFVWVQRETGEVEPVTWVNASWAGSKRPWCRMSERPPEPYVAPIDTSLAASIERMEKLSMQIVHTDQFCDDFDRIIEAAQLVAKRTAYAREIRKGDNSVSAALERHKKRMEHLTDGRDPLSFAVSMADCDLTDNCTCELCDDRRVQEAAKKEVLRQATKDYMEAVTPSCGPSVSEPGASSPVTAGSSRSVGEAELPDPGEGWELCSKNKGEQWCVVFGETQHAWQDGKNKYADFHRRRVVMRVMPKGDGPCWRFDREERSWVASELRIARLTWNSDETRAWCHRLDGEQEPPQFALDWAREMQ